MSHGSDSSSETYPQHAVPWVRSPLSLANKLDLKELKDPEEPLHALRLVSTCGKSFSTLGMANAVFLSLFRIKCLFFKPNYMNDEC